MGVRPPFPLRFEVYGWVLDTRILTIRKKKLVFYSYYTPCQSSLFWCHVLRTWTLSAESSCLSHFRDIVCSEVSFWMCLVPRSVSAVPGQLRGFLCRPIYVIQPKTGYQNQRQVRRLFSTSFMSAKMFSLTFWSTQLILWCSGCSSINIGQSTIRWHR